MKNRIAKTILGTALLAPCSLLAQYTEAVLPFPAAPGSIVPYGIDDANQISGEFSDGSQSHGFVFSRGVMGQIDQPTATQTNVFGINSVSGVVGAAYQGTSGFGIIDAKRKYKIAANSTAKTITGINASGTFVGYDQFGAGFINTNGVYSAVLPAMCTTLPEPYFVQVDGVNAGNDLVGFCFALFDPTQAHGFARISGVDQEIKFGNYITVATGINDAGAIAGYFTPDNFGTTHGFVYSGGVYTQEDFGAGFGQQYTSTAISAINNSGSLTGVTFDSQQNIYVGFYRFAN